MPPHALKQICKRPLLRGRRLRRTCRPTSSGWPVAVAAIVAAGTLGVAYGCKSRRGTTGVASASSTAAVLPEARDVVFTSRDGMPLRGRYVASADPASPLVVLVHQFRGSAAQWRPLVDRLAAPPRHSAVLAFDLRGHGASTVDAKAAHLDWTALSNKDVPGLVWDIHAAIDHGLSASGGRARSVIVIGASVSAALAAQVAREQPKVIAIALVSPGDMLEGYDVFHRYHAVKDLPAFVAAAEGDTVALEPAKIIGRLGGDRVTLKLYPGSGHGPQALTRSDDRLWRDLSDWIERVSNQRPTGRATVARGSPPDFVLPMDRSPLRRQAPGLRR